jgi:hypothetical protein
MAWILSQRIAALTEAYPEVRVIGLYWDQGESDGMTTVRQDTGIPELPFFIRKHVFDWDNIGAIIAFCDLGFAATGAPGYREEEIKKVVAHRIHYVLESYRQADGGLSSYLDRCIPTWLKGDMAPAMPQGNVFGWGISVRSMTPTHSLRWAKRSLPGRRP